MDKTNEKLEFQKEIESYLTEFLSIEVIPRGGNEFSIQLKLNEKVISSDCLECNI